MSAAIIVDTFPRWSERFIARELNELKRQGIAFTIYCLRAGDSDCDSDPEFADLLQHRIVLPSCFLPSFARELGMDAAAKARLKLVESELGVTAFRQIGCADSLTKIIREHKHGVIYAHFASLPSTLGWLAAEALKLPLIISCHARDVFVDAQLLKEKIATARRLFVCNQKAARHLAAACDGNGQSIQKITFMPHGLPLQRYPFSARRERGATENVLRLLAAGRFVPKKGFDILIDALADPVLANANVSLTILGDGPQRSALQRRIAKHNLASRVTLPGVVFNAELKTHFDSADALIMPCVETQDGDSDGVPNVVLEAFALGVPVIGTSAGSLNDVLNEETGFMIKHDSMQKALASRQLALAIRELLLEPQRAKQRADAARAVLEKHYDIGATVEPLINELRACESC